MGLLYPRRKTGDDAGDRRRGQVLLEQRPPSGIWGGLLSLPELAGHAPAEDDKVAAADQHALGLAVAPFGEMETQERLSTITHVFTHYKLHIAPYRVTLARARGTGRRRGPPLVRRREHPRRAAAGADQETAAGIIG